MRRFMRLAAMVVMWAPISKALAANDQDWPQWRGPNRDARAAGFEAPKTWPAELTQKWKVMVGEGVATPALVGDKLYVFARQDGNEVLRCLNAATGDEIWKDQYATEAIRGPASSFDGPRSSPTVVEGKVIALGAQGMLSCLNAESGAVVWRNDDNVGNVPRFATSSSPIVVAGLVITEFGADEDGGVVAYDLNSGDERWKWTEGGATYGSPVQMSIGGVQAIVAPMAENMVALSAADGKVLWQIPYRQGRYNSATPIVHEDMLIIAGPNSGMTAFKFTRQGDSVEAEEVWKNPDNSVGFSTPVLTDGKLCGISGLNSLFCITVDDGATAWNAPLGGDAQAQAGQGGGERRRGDEGGEGRRRGGFGRGGRRGGGGGGGYGSVIDVGSALIALVPSGQLTVFAPGDVFTQLASYKVAEAGTYAYPVPSRFGLFIKDQDSVALWTASP